ncbi:MAG: NTP transferase domain-containing protein [Phycisphaeraceae bacterium]|nr:NTP transferase domain-containing protein [Phycisphaeraceae bacterium]
MKGIILAGGLGSRLRPLTLVTNKHLLPVYDRPMIYYPIECLLNAGIRDILIVTGGEHAGDFLKLLKNGKHLGVSHLEYAYQEGEGGIADALKLAEEFADGDKICVVLGDNVIEKNIRKAAGDFFTQRTGAKILLKEVPDPERFGVVKFENDDPGSRIVEVIEKPQSPPSRYAVTGIYFYDADVFKVCGGLKPSGRGELEITDVNNYYLERGDLTHEILEGWWTDAGTFESLHRASTLIAQSGANHVDGIGAARDGGAAAGKGAAGTPARKKVAGRA